MAQVAQNWKWLNRNDIAPDPVRSISEIMF